MASVKFIDFKDDPYRLCYVVPEYKGNFRYIIYDRIGRGSYGKVYKVINNSTKKEHALKLSSRFHNENQREVDHYLHFSKVEKYEKYFPKVYQIFNCFSNFYLVMELIQGGHFDNRLISIKKLSFRKVIPIVKHLTKAIRLIHKNKRVLNDLKPDNVMIDHNDGKPRIIDLGLMTAYGDSTQCHRGSPVYMAPEAYKEIVSNGKKDVWALGVTIYELLTGQNHFDSLVSTDSDDNLVFDKDRLPEVLDKMKEEYKNFRKGKEHRNTLKKFGNFIFSCLEIDPKERPSASQLLKHELFAKKIKASQYKGSQYFTGNQIRVNKLVRNVGMKEMKLKRSL